MKYKRFKNQEHEHMADVQHQFKAKYDESTDSTKLVIYGEIGDYWWDSTSAADVERALRDVTSKTIHVHLNSGGGDAFDGIAIYNQLKNHDAEIIIHIDGLAASAASIIAMAGDKVYMNTGSMKMVHEASTIAFGTKADITKTLGALTGIDTSLVDIYMNRFKGEREEMETLLVNETWMTVSEAIAFGFADEEVEVLDPDATAKKAEQYKASLLDRFKKVEPVKPAASAKQNMLSQFKRSSNE